MNNLDFKKWIFMLNEYSRFRKNEYLFWMDIMDFHKMNSFLNKYFGFSLPASKTLFTNCLKLIWNHSGIISGTYFSPFQGVFYPCQGLRRALKPYFGLILEFWIIFHIFFEWRILLNNLDSIEWVFFKWIFFEWIFSKRIDQG